MKAFIGFLIAFALIVIGQTANAQSGIGNKMFVQEYLYDFAVDGGAVGFISLINPANPLPVGAIVTSIHYHQVAAFTSGGSATVSIGDAGSNARYLALTAFDNAAYALDNVAALSTAIPNLVSSANEGNVGITVAVAALTAGKIKLVVQGYVPKNL